MTYTMPPPAAPKRDELDPNETYAHMVARLAPPTYKTRAEAKEAWDQAHPTERYERMIARRDRVIAALVLILVCIALYHLGLV